MSSLYFFIKERENIKLVKVMLTLEVWIQTTDTVRTCFITNLIHNDIVY